MGVWRESVAGSGNGFPRLRSAAKKTEGCGSAAHSSRFRDWGACAGERVYVADAGRGHLSGVVSAVGDCRTVKQTLNQKMGEAEQLMAPVHPGEILREDFMKPLGLSVNKLALELHVPATRIGEIVHERRRITAETALRLARYFQKNAEVWVNQQNLYDF